MEYYDEFGSVRDFKFENMFIVKNKHYDFFVVNISDQTIVSGWEYKEDAQEHKNEYVEFMDTLKEKTAVKVYTRKFAETYFGKLSGRPTKWKTIKKITQQ